MRVSEVRATRLRTIRQHASKVKSYDELVAFALSRFGVTRETAKGYVDAVIEQIRRSQNV